MPKLPVSFRDWVPMQNYQAQVGFKRDHAWGGSLASSLFLGVLAGTSLLWLQPVAIILGVIMLAQ